MKPSRRRCGFCGTNASSLRWRTISPTWRHTRSAPPPREQRAALERKHTWRHEQRDRALKDSQRATVTLRYREIAHILNAPVGSVSAQVTRLRQDLLNLAAQHGSGRRRAP